MKKVFYLLSALLLTIGSVADPDSTWTARMNDTWARQWLYRRNINERMTPTSDWRLRKLHQLTMRDGGEHQYDLEIKMNARWVVNGRRGNVAKTKAIYYRDIKFGPAPEYTLTYKSVMNPFNIADAFERYKTNGQPFSHFELNLSRSSDGNRARYNCAAEMNSNWWHNGDNCMRHRPLTNDPGKGRGSAEWVADQPIIWSEMRIRRVRKPTKWEEYLKPSQKL